MRKTPVESADQHAPRKMLFASRTESVISLAARMTTRFPTPYRLPSYPSVHLFTPIFFVTVGLSLDLRRTDWGSRFFWGFSLTLVTVAIFSKFTGAMFIDEPLPRRVVIGMAMVPRGEVGLIFSGLGSAAGLLTGDVYTALIIVIAYTTLFSPFWIKQYYRHFGRYL